MEEYKIGYSFSPVTGEFITEEIVYLEKRTGEYPHASNVTFIKPPKVSEHQKQIWNGKNWKVVPDYRGTVYFNNEGLPIGCINDLDISVEDKIIVPPPEHREHEKVRFNATINNWDVYLDENFTKNEDGTIREKTIKEKVISGLIPIPEGMKLVNGEIVTITKEDRFNAGELTVEEYNKLIDEERQGRYMMETDKMAFMYLRGECTLDEWKAAMDKIREELPKK